VKYNILSGNEESLFMLDQNSGILYPAQSLSGRKGKYRLHIEARDELGSGPNTDTAEVIIEVQTINQHRPVFVMPALSNATVEIPEVSSFESFFFQTGISTFQTSRTWPPPTTWS
jgi:Cadherin domain